ncbi:hypothetical protein CYMTET_49822 [Cymbomonas tetramitiformis]|uniref:Cyclic nucleotide-binding domain-containing protein n=1 Tax=Cymbomonas tetramitiformis TaxID=36881 RepID=A0AAE0BPI5_9CHLO|nr:hypothetical protein CYMTET_49822 [Cymbomonas tetramitiformis]
MHALKKKSLLLPGKSPTCAPITHTWTHVATEEGGNPVGNYSDFMVHPRSAIRRYWDSVVGLLCIYCAIAVPINIAFALVKTLLSQVLDRVVDCVFVLDIVMNFFTGYYDRGMIIMDQTQVGQQYIKSWLLADVLSSVPYDIIFMTDDMISGAENDVFRLHTLLRLMKVGRLFRLQRIFQRFQSFFYVQYSYITVINILLVWAFYTHWFACAFIYMSRVEFEVGMFQEDDVNGDIKKQREGWDGWFKEPHQRHPENAFWLDDDLYSQYVLALYHVVMIMLTIDMVYRPENSVERVFTVSFGGLGTGLLVYGSTVVVNLAITSATALHDRFRKMDFVNEMVRHNHLRKETGTRIFSFYAHVHDRVIPIQALKLMEELPAKLQEEIMLDLYAPILSTSHMFGHMDSELAGAVLRRLTQRCFVPGEALVYAGKPATAMYVICQGLARREMPPQQQQQQENGRGDEGQLLMLGDVVGDAMFVNLEKGEPVREEVTVHAVEFCDAPRLRRDQAEEMFDALPEAVAAAWRRSVERFASSCMLHRDCGGDPGQSSSGGQRREPASSGRRPPLHDSPQRDSSPGDWHGVNYHGRSNSDNDLSDMAERATPTIAALTRELDAERARTMVEMKKRVEAVKELSKCKEQLLQLQRDSK